MAMFGQQRPYGTPGINPAANEAYEGLTPDPTLAAMVALQQQQQPKKRGLFGGALKGIGDFFMYGGPRIREEMQMRREDASIDRDYKRAQIEEWRRKQQPEPEEPTELQRKIEYLQTLNPNMTPEQAFAIASSSMMPMGPQTYNSGSQQITERIDPLTGQPKVVATAPRWEPKQGGGVSAAQAAKYRAEAAAAIARGADPAAVNARLAQILGGN